MSVDRRQILLDKPIKALGVHNIRVQLHPEVVVKVAINVARSMEEAEKQSRGEDVTMVKDERPVIETFSEDGDYDATDRGPSQESADQG